LSQKPDLAPTAILDSQSRIKVDSPIDSKSIQRDPTKRPNFTTKPLAY